MALLVTAASLAQQRSVLANLGFKYPAPAFLNRVPRQNLGQQLMRCLPRQIAAVNAALVITLEPFGGLASVTPASVLQLAVVMRAYEMVCCPWGSAACRLYQPSQDDALLALLLHLCFALQARARCRSSTEVRHALLD